MISRYETPEMRVIFSDAHRFSVWLELEILVVEAYVERGLVPKAHAESARARMPVVDQSFIDEVDRREAITNHDVAAFVDVVQERIGQPEGGWIHYGLTSSDIVDTGLSLMMVEALDTVIAELREAIAVVAGRAVEHRHTVMVGRTHGIHAEPTTFGAKIALWALQLERDLGRLRRARETMAVGKLSGAVGTYSNIDPQVEAAVLDRVGLRPTPATQVVARDRHAEVMYALASLGSSIESFATEIRHLQRTEVREVEESFGSGQKGSSAMPHKRNPILSERLSGMARVLRGYLGASLEDVALWHERDISHSSVERIVVPDAFHLAHYVTRRFKGLLGSLVIYPDRMNENLWSSYGLVFSQPVLLSLVRSGLSRDEAYRIVQRNAMKAWQERRSFRELLNDDPEVNLDDETIAQVMDPASSLRNVEQVFRALDGIEERTR
ncbi:MAG: adenylosuccinate lyase [Acidimicrobiales bacterium]